VKTGLLGNDVALTGDVKGSNWPKENRVVVASSEGVVQETLGLEFEMRNRLQSKSSKSRSKSKAIQVAINSCIEEGIEISKQDPTVQINEANANSYQ